MAIHHVAGAAEFGLKTLAKQADLATGSFFCLAKKQFDNQEGIMEDDYGRKIQAYYGCYSACPFAIYPGSGEVQIEQFDPRLLRCRWMMNQNGYPLDKSSVIRPPVNPAKCDPYFAVGLADSWRKSLRDREGEE